MSSTTTWHIKLIHTIKEPKTSQYDRFQLTDATQWASKDHTVIAYAFKGIGWTVVMKTSSNIRTIWETVNPFFQQEAGTLTITETQQTSDRQADTMLKEIHTIDMERKQASQPLKFTLDPNNQNHRLLTVDSCRGPMLKLVTEQAARALILPEAVRQLDTIINDWNKDRHLADGKKLVDTAQTIAAIDSGLHVNGNVLETSIATVTESNWKKLKARFEDARKLQTDRKTQYQRKHLIYLGFTLYVASILSATLTVTNLWAKIGPTITSLWPALGSLKPWIPILVGGIITVGLIGIGLWATIRSK